MDPVLSNCILSAVAIISYRCFLPRKSLRSREAHRSADAVIKNLF
jgi:hypothetical protein